MNLWGLNNLTAPVVSAQCCGYTAAVMGAHINHLDCVLRQLCLQNKLKSWLGPGIAVCHPTQWIIVTRKKRDRERGMWRKRGRERICEQWITDPPPTKKKNHKQFVENNQSVWGVVVADSFNTCLYKSFRKWFLSWEVHKISIFQMKKKLNVQTGLVQTPNSVILTQNPHPLATEHTVLLYITWRSTINTIPSLLWSFAISFGFTFSG